LSILDPVGLDIERADDAHPVEMGARDELLVAVNNGVRRRRWLLFHSELREPIGHCSLLPP
jgi:hypothetical protein